MLVDKNYQPNLKGQWRQANIFNRQIMSVCSIEKKLFGKQQVFSCVGDVWPQSDSLKNAVYRGKAGKRQRQWNALRCYFEGFAKNEIGCGKTW